MKNKIQYNAAVKYLEKNNYRIKLRDSYILVGILLVLVYFVGLYIFKILSCF